MRLVFIRHCEPDYEKDSLTKKGFREAEILAQRVGNWKVDRFFCKQGFLTKTLNIHVEGASKIVQETAAT
ncbi:MAG: hypothetical protein GX685_12105 [Clostridiales bacterium]|nr:hypothetical protein [Clostridiales bacterium]